MIDQTIDFIKNHFKNDASGHDYYHSMRVYHLASVIANTEPCNLFIVQMAALLHDVDDRKLTSNFKELPTTRRYLKSLNLPDAQLEDICKIISDVSFKSMDTTIPSSIEGKIVQDADRLDALGAIGIARAFAYGGSIGRSIYIPDLLPKQNMHEEEYYNNIGTTINHFHEKLLKLNTLMNTKTGKKLANHRHLFIEQFLKEFYKEWDCEL